MPTTLAINPLAYAVAVTVLVSACERVGESAPPADSAAAPAVTAVGAESRRSAVLRARYPDRELVMGEASPIPGTRFEAETFSYRPTAGEWPYGTGIAVWSAGDASPAWTYLHDGDFGPHQLVWQDLTGDGWPDLFFHGGEEDIYETYAFVWRDTSGRSGDSTLVRAYVDENDYAALVDLDGDQAPELLDAGTPGSTHDSVDECEGIRIPPELQERAHAEYQRIAARFDEANFTYGTSGFAIWTLHVLHPVRVLQLRGSKAQDVTARFGDHLRWRVELLEDLRPAVTAQCAAAVDRTIEYLRGRLGQAP